MTRAQQIIFVRELCSAVNIELMQTIRSGKVPESWDGHELRALIAKKFDDSAKMSLIVREPRSKRAKDFKKEILVNYAL